MNASDQGQPSAANIAHSSGAAGRILWEGRPPAGIRFRMRHLAFLGMWLLLVALYVRGDGGGQARGGKGDPPPLVFVIAFGAAGLIEVLWIDPRTRSRILYVLTETQFIVEGKFFGGGIRRFDLARMHDVEMLRRADDSGKLILSSPRRVNEPPGQFLDVYLFASGGKHYTDVSIGIDVDGGIKALRERFNAAIHEARERQTEG